MGSVGSTAETLLRYILDETNTKTVCVTLRMGVFEFRFLHHDGSHQVMGTPKYSSKTIKDPEIQAIFREVRKCANIIQFDQLAWTVGTTM